MLKVLHTGDWHIGSFPGPEVGGQNARFQDICRCLDFQAMYAEEHRPDLIVVSGDIFHQARVWSDRGLRESRTAIDHIRRLSNVAPTVVLRGTPNHDSEEQFEMLTTAFYGDDSVSVVTEPEVLHIHTYHGQRVDVACIPGFDRGVHRAAHPGLSREDLGKEQCTDWSVSTLYSILNDRYEDMKPTIITTNYNADELVRALTPKGGDGTKARAIISRLREVSTVITMAWPDYRTGGSRR